MVPRHQSWGNDEVSGMALIVDGMFRNCRFSCLFSGLVVPPRELSGYRCQPRLRRLSGVFDVWAQTTAESHHFVFEPRNTSQPRLLRSIYPAETLITTAQIRETGWGSPHLRATWTQPSVCLADMEEQESDPARPWADIRHLFAWKSPTGSGSPLMVSMFDADTSR